MAAVVSTVSLATERIRNTSVWSAYACWENIYLLSLPYPTDTTVVFSIQVMVSFPSVGPRGSTGRTTGRSTSNIWTSLTWHWGHQLISCQAVNHSTPESISDWNLHSTAVGPSASLESRRYTWEVDLPVPIVQVAWRFIVNISQDS